MSKSDSFEAAMWPVLNVLRLKGYFPVTRRGRKLEFSLIWLLIDVLICIVTYAPAFLLIYRGLQMIPHQDPNIQLFSYVFLIGLSTFIFLSFLTLLRTFPHINFCNKVHSFKVLLSQISSYSSLHFDEVRRWTVATPVFLILPFIGNMVVTPALGRRLPNLAMDFYLSLISSEMIIMLVWWRGTMQALSDCSRALLASYKNITMGQVISLDGDAENRILAFRSLWLFLCDLLRDAGNVFPITYIGLILLNVFICSYSLYELLAIPEFSVIMHFIFYATLPFAAFTAICMYPQRATTQIYNDILKAMEITQRHYLSSDLKTQLVPAVLSNMIILVQFNTHHKTYDAAYFSRTADYLNYAGTYKYD